MDGLDAEVRGTVYARAKAQEAGYGLETELAEPDGALVAAAAAAPASSCPSAPMFRMPAVNASETAVPASARGTARMPS